MSSVLLSLEKKVLRKKEVSKLQYPRMYIKPRTHAQVKALAKKLSKKNGEKVAMKDLGDKIAQAGLPIIKEQLGL